MKKIHKHTVRSRYVIIAVLAAILLILICAFFTTLTMQQIRERMANAADTSVRLMASSLQNEMEYESSYMINNAISNMNLRKLGGNLSRTDAYSSLYEVKMASEYLKSANENLTGYIVCSVENDVYMNLYDSSWSGDLVNTLLFFQNVEQEMKKLLGSGPLDTENWFCFPISNHTCLVRVVKYRLVYQVCMIDLNKLLDNFLELYSLEGKLAICDKENQMLAGSGNVNIHNIEWNHPDYGSVRLENENYLAVREACNDLQFIYFIKDETLRDSYEILLLIITVMTVIMVIIYFTGWLYLRRTVFRPLDSLVNTMERIKEGDYAYQSGAVYDNEEFKRVNETFKEMVGEIIHLRIDSYEQQLSAERSELAALKMQIRPHFVLNCLKNVYALVETQRISQVKSLILLLSKHLRYILSFADDRIKLEQELEMCQNYAELLNVGQNKKINCRILLDDQIRELKIPNVSILTLIENCIKHGDREGHDFEITVSAKYLNMENGGLVNITVSDNGNGFSQEQITRMNQRIPVEKDGYHVGIGNVFRRMQLCFGPETAIAFSNKKTGGAVIDIYISIISLGKTVTNRDVDEDTDGNGISDEEFWKDMQDK